MTQFDRAGFMCPPSITTPQRRKGHLASVNALSSGGNSLGQHWVSRAGCPFVWHPPYPPYLMADTDASSQKSFIGLYILGTLIFCVLVGILGILAWQMQVTKSQHALPVQQESSSSIDPATAARRLYNQMFNDNK